MPVGSDLILILIVVLIIVLLVRGPKNLPKLGESLGQSISGFRRAVKEDDDPSKATATEPDAATAAPCLHQPDLARRPAAPAAPVAPLAPAAPPAPPAADAAPSPIRRPAAGLTPVSASLP